MRTAFGADFAISTGYLNTPSIGVPPAQVADTVEAVIRDWRTGAATPADFEPSVAASRAGFGRLIGVGADRVAIGANVSQFVGLVAAGLPDGARVLVAKGEFTSVTFPFAAQAGRGVTVTEADLAEIPALAGNHDLVAVSVVQSADGAMADLTGLRDSGVPVLLDVSQAAGWMPLRLDWADWVVGAGYKWLLSPRGCAWLAVHPRAMDRTRPVAANWYAGENPWQTTYDLPLRLAGTARRFDLSPVWFAHAGAVPALDYLASLDLAAVRKHCAGLADELLGKLGRAPRGSAIVALEAEGTEDFASAGIVSSGRAGRTRLGFHLYNNTDDVAAVLRAMGR